MYEIILEDGTELLASPKHKVYDSIVEKEPSEPPLVDSIMMIEILQDDDITINLKDKYITSDTNPFKMAQVMPEVLEVINFSVIAGSNLTYLPLESSEQDRVFMSEPSHDFLNPGSI